MTMMEEEATSPTYAKAIGAALEGRADLRREHTGCKGWGAGLAWFCAQSSLSMKCILGGKHRKRSKGSRLDYR